MNKIYIITVLAFFFVVTSCQRKSEKQDEAINNKEWVKKFYESNNKGNFDQLKELIAEDYTEHEPLPGFSPNREGVLQFFKMMRNSFPDINNEVNFIISEKDRVVVYVTLSGTHQEDYFGAPPTGKKFSITVIDIIEIKNGKMTAHWGVGDYYTQYLQLGIIQE